MEFDVWRKKIGLYKKWDLRTKGSQLIHFYSQKQVNSVSKNMFIPKREFWKQK